MILSFENLIEPSIGETSASTDDRSDPSCFDFFKQQKPGCAIAVTKLLRRTPGGVNEALSERHCDADIRLPLRVLKFVYLIFAFCPQDPRIPRGHAERFLQLMSHLLVSKGSACVIALLRLTGVTMLAMAPYSNDVEYFISSRVSPM